MFSSIEEFAAKLKSVRYLIAEEMLPAIYLAMKLGRPLLVEGPPGSGKTELASAVARAAGTFLERLKGYVGIDEEKAIGRFDHNLQRLFLETAQDAAANGWEPICTKLHGLEFFMKGPLIRSLLYEASDPYQRLLDSIFHNWVAMGLITVALWIARGISAASMPSALRIVSGLLLLFSALITGLAAISHTA